MIDSYQNMLGSFYQLRWKRALEWFHEAKTFIITGNVQTAMIKVVGTSIYKHNILPNLLINAQRKKNHATYDKKHWVEVKVQEPRKHCNLNKMYCTQ